jgi:hypothetical protein
LESQGFDEGGELENDNFDESERQNLYQSDDIQHEGGDSKRDITVTGVAAEGTNIVIDDAKSARSNKSAKLNESKKHLNVSVRSKQNVSIMNKSKQQSLDRSKMSNNSKRNVSKTSNK